MAIKGFKDEYRWLSNFYPSVVVLDREIYHTVEHAYQAAKTLNKEERLLIQQCPTPGKAKRLGKKLTLRADWLDFRDSVMEELLRQKFRYPYLKGLLKDTGDEEIIETNNWGDMYWGVCNNAGCNRLGKLIMKIRSELQAKTPQFFDIS